MNVGGLSNLGSVQPAHNASAARVGQGKNRSSFASALDLAQTPTQSQPQTQTQTQSQSPTSTPTQAHTQSRTLTHAQNQAQNQSQTATETNGQNESGSQSTNGDSLVNRPASPRPSASDVGNGEPSGFSGGTNNSVITTTDGDTAVDPSAEGNLDPSPDEVSLRSLPSPSGLPGLAGPGLSDRVGNVPIAPKAANPAAKTPSFMVQDDPANSLTRRVVWNDFLRKMNEMGVSAEDVLHAFASLSEKELAQPPEQSVDRVVLALGLDNDQSVLARKYFVDLIQKTKSKSLGEELASSHRQISLTLMSQRDAQRKALQKSLENMGRSFFMNPLPVAQPTAQLPQQPGEVVDANSARATGATQSDSRVLNALNATPPALPFRLDGPVLPTPIPSDSGNSYANADGAALNDRAYVRAMTPESASAFAPAGTAGRQGQPVDQLVAQMQAQQQSPSRSEVDNKSFDQIVQNFNARSGSPGSPSAFAGPAAVATNAAATTALPAAAALTSTGSAAASVPFSALSSLFSGGREQAGSGESSGDGGNTEQNNLVSAAMAGDSRSISNTNPTGDFQSELRSAHNSPPAMALPELVQQAEVMVREGGGEMKVTLNPEGLGEVAMRISVDGGKVNVQMITESDEAKKMLERQVNELKSSLASNHLQVDSIKVDTASNLGRQLDQQYQEAQRQSAHHNLEQFRQDHQGWRRSFFDTGTVAPYQSQSDAPRDVNSPKGPSAKQMKSRRLDLVA